MKNILLIINKSQIIKAVFLSLIPLFLKLKTGTWLNSISAYYHSTGRDDFIIMLVIAALLYVEDGIYNQKWWNISIGLSLIGVAYFDHINYPVIHYVFAGYFFIGTALSMVIFSSSKQRKYKILVSVLILAIMLLHFMFNIFSLLIAEWVCLIPMSLHFIGESSGRID